MGSRQRPEPDQQADSVRQSLTIPFEPVAEDANTLKKNTPGILPEPASDSQSSFDAGAEKNAVGTLRT